MFYTKKGFINFNFLFGGFMNNMEKSTENPEKIKFIYKKSDGHNTYFSNGAIGSISPLGEFEFNFYFEHRELPKDEVFDIEGSQPEEEIATDLTIIRDLQVGIIMTPQQAENLGDWLISRVKEHKNEDE